jgi:septum formation protein
MLLRQLGIRFGSLRPDVDESQRPGEAVLPYVQRLALAKAEAGWRQLAGLNLPPLPVLAADTSVVCDTLLLGKPDNTEHAVQMLLSLSARWHEVATAVAVRYKDQTELVYTQTRVKFRAIARSEAHAYVASGEPMGKAGAYAVQGQGGRFVERIEGSYSGVVGLPLVETEALLQRCAIQCRW